jgi:hypothetical protein
LKKGQKNGRTHQVENFETLLATLRMHLGKGETQESEMFENAALAAPLASSI